MPSLRAETTLRVRVQPSASRESILGWREDVLRVAVTARPVEGAAYEAVRRLLARTLRVAPSAVSVIRGERGRDKIVRIAGVTEAELRSVIDMGGLASGPPSPPTGGLASGRPSPPAGGAD
jgi:hypothetical protein